MTQDAVAEETGWYSNEYATFGDRVAAARDVLGMSQEDLARKLGVKLKTVQGWEDDVSEPRANRLQMLSGLLNVSLTWLLNGEGDGVAAPGDLAELPASINDMLSDIRHIRTQLAQASERLALTERRLRTALRETS